MERDRSLSCPLSLLFPPLVEGKGKEAEKCLCVSRKVNAIQASIGIAWRIRDLSLWARVLNMCNHYDVIPWIV